MANDISITPGSGATVATEDLGSGRQAQLVKVGIGPAGSSTTLAFGQAAAAASLPVVLASDTVLPLPSGAATAAAQATQTTALALLHTDLTAPLPAGTNTIGGVLGPYQRNTTAGTTDTGFPALGVVMDTRTATGIADGNYGMPRVSSFGAMDVRASQGLTATNSASSAAVLFTQDCNDYTHVALQFTGTFTATITYEVSNDNSTWLAFSLTSGTSTAAGPASTTTTTGLANGYVPWRYFRARVSAWTSGTVVCVSTFKNLGAPSVAQQNVNISQFNSGSVTSGMPIGSSAGTNSLTATRVVAATSTNLTALKASAGRLYYASFTNAAAYAVYVKMYNIASGSVTVGTSAIKYTWAVPAGTTYTVPISDLGLYFSNAGWSFAMTKLAADNDATPLVAGDCIAHFEYA